MSLTALGLRPCVCHHSHFQPCLLFEGREKERESGGREREKRERKREGGGAEGDKKERDTTERDTTERSQREERACVNGRVVMLVRKSWMVWE